MRESGVAGDVFDAAYHDKDVAQGMQLLRVLLATKTKVYFVDNARSTNLESQH